LGGFWVVLDSTALSYKVLIVYTGYRLLIIATIVLKFFYVRAFQRGEFKLSG
jgi:hypothetical protein